MKNKRSAFQGFSALVAAGALAFTLSGCGSGSDGAPGAPGPGVASPAAATALNINITGATISSPPVVTFKVTNQDGVAVAGLTLTDLRFTIAKLVPGSNGAPSKWQNYINTASSGLATGYVRGNRENNGTLVDNKDGTYTYTFKTDIKDTAQTCPVASCIDADGNAIDTSYNASLTHRIAVQTRGTLPMVNGIYTFRPSDGATTGLFSREIVNLAKCNECHNKLQAHDARIETQYCVMCHNPGSSAKGQEGTVVGPMTVDFKVMIHKIHNGPELHSVTDVAGGDYGIFGYSGTLASFKDVHFPQDIRNCTKCHDGTVGAANATAQGDNWKTQPSKAACSSCHDDVYFNSALAGSPAYKTVNHPALSGIDNPDDSMCTQCHGPGKFADVAVKHNFPSLLKAEGAKYKLTIVSVTNTTPTLFPTVKFSITNASGTPYDIAATPAITGGSMSLIIGWDTKDINNTPNSNAQPISISLLSGGALVGSVTNNGDGTYSVTSTTAIPATATGSGRVGFYARMSVDVDGDGTSDRVQVKSVVKDFLITGSSIVARRTVVNINNCDRCHETLSLHGDARTDEPQLCVICHNPNATDTARRPVGAPTGTLDNKKEEAIDFKRLIHGVHSAAKTNYDGSAAHGFREKGLVVYGYGGSVNDFSHLRFPGILNDCSTCHAGTSYQMTGLWQSPTQSGILGSTIDHGTSLTDPADDLNISPTAAVCSACHDTTLAQTHMTLNGGLFSSTQVVISGNTETCSICHGPGAVADVKVVHGVP